MRKICNDALVRIEVDVEQSLLISQWNGYVPSEEYRTALWQILDEVRVHKLCLWLSDTREMGIILRADEKWSMEVFVPELMKHGLRRVGLVQSQDYFTQTVTERLAEATVAVAPFKVGMFSSPETALVWLVKELEALV